MSAKEGAYGGEDRYDKERCQMVHQQFASQVCTVPKQDSRAGDDQTLDDPKLSTAEVGENAGAN